MADRSTTPIDLPELSGTPATPGSGYHRFYAKTDGKPYSKSAAGTEYPLTYTHPNHTGDVTSTGDGATTIAANAVTNAKAAQMATKTYKGRTSAGTGNAEDVAVATLKNDLILVKADVGLGNVDNTSDATKNSASATLTNKTITDGVNTVSTPTTTSIGYLGMPQVSQSAAYTLVITDAGKHILHPSADTTARTFTIPANSSVAFPIGTAVTFINQNSGGVITISITTDTMRLAGAGTTGSRTLAANGIATAVKVTSTEWLINGVNLT